MLKLDIMELILNVKINKNCKFYVNKKCIQILLFLINSRMKNSFVKKH